jgi:outer membrane protein assembly factor BamB
MRSRWRFWLGIAGVLICLSWWGGSTGSAQQPGRWPTASYLPYWRRNHSVIYDVANEQFLLFGGWNGRRFFNDVWAFDFTPGAERWVQVQPEGVRPRPRAWHTAVYDAANSRMVLFGGRGFGGDLDDVWTLDLTPGSERWDRLTPSGSPPSALSAHSAVYDADNQRMVVFAGARSGALQDDLWALDLTPGSESWSLLKLSGEAPPARAFHTAIVDGAHDRMIVFGGQGLASSLDDTWTLDLAPGSESWQMLAPAGPLPPARRFHSAVYDVDNGRMIVFGGMGSECFLDDLWVLGLAPGSEAWGLLQSAAHISSAFAGDVPGQGSPASPVDWPPGRAWHSATLVEARMWVLGGFGPLQTLLDQQWSLDVTMVGWERVSPVEPVLASYVSAGLQVEDAPDGVLVNKLVASWTDVVVKVASTNFEASQEVEVTLTAHGNPFGVPTACFQQTGDGPCLPLLVDAEGEGRYTTGVTGLSWHFGSWAGQIRFRFYILQIPTEPVVDFTAQARFGDIERDATGAVRVCEHADALIVTNRTRLYEAFDDDEVQLLLGRLYELAEAEGAGGQPGAEGGPLGVVAYVDRDSTTVAEWDNWEVDYTSESTANTVARIVDDRIESWAYRADGPTYLLIVGDDDVVPFYRKESYGDEAQYPEVGNYYQPLNDLVSNDYYFTDNPYADVDGGWEQGDLEMAAGRIVGESPADMLAFVDNSLLGPTVGSGQAVVMSVRGLQPQWPTGEAVRDAMLAGAGNDLVDALRDDWGLDVLNDMESPVTIETRDWDRDDLEAIMAQGFLVFQSMGHTENKYLLLPNDQRFDAPSWGIFEEDRGCLAANHPFFYIHGCRAGLSLARHKDDGLVWAWVHHGVSGVIASAGLAYSDWDAEETGSGETLANQFWQGAIEGNRPVGTVGVVLRDAKRDFDAQWDWSDSEKKTVQAYTLFGLPWMSLPEMGGALGAQPAAEPGWPVAAREPRPGLSLAEDTYVVTATVDASLWAITTLHGFDVVEVEGMRLSRRDDAPVVPIEELHLALPQQARVTTVTAVLSDEVDLGTLNIPTLIHRADYPGGLPSVYSETLDAVGVYPTQAYRLDVTPFNSWQLARLSLTPFVYDAASDQATLFEQMVVSVTYTATTPVAAISLRTDQATYLPGQAILARAWLRNVGDADLPVTPTLSIANPAGQVVGMKPGMPVTLTAGSLTSVPVGINPALDEGAYRLRFRAWSEGEMVADLARDVSVLAGQIVAVTVPETLLPGDTGRFEVTFANARPDPVVAMAHLAVFDPAGQMVSDLQPQVTVVSGTATATVAFDWQLEGGLPGIYAGVGRVLSGGYVYGPRSRPIRIHSRVYLPLLMRGVGE